MQSMLIIFMENVLLANVLPLLNIELAKTATVVRFVLVSVLFRRYMPFRIAVIALMCRFAPNAMRVGSAARGVPSLLIQTRKIDVENKCERQTQEPWV